MTLYLTAASVELSHTQHIIYRRQSLDWRKTSKTKRNYNQWTKQKPKQPCKETTMRLRSHWYEYEYESRVRVSVYGSVQASPAWVSVQGHLYKD